MPNAGVVSAGSLIACALKVLCVQCAANDSDLMPTACCRCFLPLSCRLLGGTAELRGTPSMFESLFLFFGDISGALGFACTL